MKRISTDAEYLDSGKLVIDANGISAQILPGIRIDTTIGTRVFTGDTMIHGDTGWRR